MNKNQQTIDKVRMLADQMAGHFRSKRDADANLKATKESIFDLVSNNPTLFFEPGKKSFKVGDIVVKVAETTNYTATDEFDLIAFMKKYPASIKYDFQKSKMNNIDLAQYGITTSSVEKMDVEYKPVEATV